MADDKVVPSCDCHKYERQVCDICQGVTGNEKDVEPVAPSSEPSISADLKTDEQRKEFVMRAIAIRKQSEPKFAQLDFLNECNFGSLDTYSGVTADLALDRIAELEGALQSIHNWCEAYPLEVFPKPDLKRARELLGDAEFTRLNAHSMRHVVEGFKVRAALAAPSGVNTKEKV